MIGVFIFTAIQIETLAVPGPKGLATEYAGPQNVVLPTYTPPAQSTSPLPDQKGSTPLGVSVPVFPVTATSPTQLLEELQQNTPNNEGSLVSIVQQLTGTAMSPGLIDRVFTYATPGSAGADDAQGSSGLAGVCQQSGLTFTKNLREGDTNNEVLLVQRFLNRYADTRVAEEGPGSPGQETSYFGIKTVDAVKRFQLKYASSILTPSGLTIPTGIWAEATRAQANRMCTV